MEQLRDGNADKQPIWITPDEENPNCAEILVLTDGALAGDLSTWQRCIEIFDGRNESAVSEARLRWSFYKSTRYELTYWQQMEGGGWEKRRIILHYLSRAANAALCFFRNCEMKWLPQYLEPFISAAK